MSPAFPLAMVACPEGEFRERGGADTTKPSHNHPKYRVWPCSCLAQCPSPASAVGVSEHLEPVRLPDPLIPELGGS